MPPADAGHPAQPFSGFPRWRMIATFVIAFVLTLWAGRLPDPLSNEMKIAALLWVGLAIAWVVQFIRWTAMGRRTKTTGRRRIARWLIGPLLFVISFVLLYFDVPLRLAFDLSRHAMDRTVRESVTGQSPSGAKWVGCYAASSVQTAVTPGQTPRVYLILSEVREHGGFVYYLSDPDPNELPGLVHLAGGWYAWLQIRKAS